MAVFLGVYASKALGGFGHLNPAVTIALVVGNTMSTTVEFDNSLAATIIMAQFAGAIAGAIIVWVAYKQHFDVTEDRDLKLAVFSTGPAIRNSLFNFLTEMIGTFVLAFGAITASKSAASMGALDALPVALLILGIGLSLGGPTGYAINPARDLGPRIVHAFLPIPGKRDSDWSYAWIPVLAPIVGAILAVFLHISISS